MSNSRSSRGVEDTKNLERVAVGLAPLTRTDVITNSLDPCLFCQTAAVAAATVVHGCRTGGTTGIGRDPN